MLKNILRKTAIFMLAVVIAAVPAFFSSCGNGGEKKQLNIYTWEAMFPPEILSAFQAETGIQINYVNFDYNETMLTKLQSQENSGYDLVIADDYILETVIKEGLAKKLDTSKISNYSNINPIYQGQFYDPDNAYTVPYGAGVQTIVYNPANVGIDIKGYSDLWDPSFKDSLGIIASYRVINGMALKVLGKSYNTESADDIKAAGDKLSELAPNIRLIKDDNIQDDLISGEISAAVMYTSQVTLAKMTDPSLEVVYPSEGIGFGIMGMFIPEGSAHSEGAYAFINYLLNPENGAKCFEYLGYYCTYSASEQYISDEYKSFLTLPEDFDTSNIEMIENISSEASELHSEIWLQFKSLCE